MSYSKSISALDRDTVYFQWGLIFCETTIDKFNKYLENDNFRNEGIGWSIGVRSKEELLLNLDEATNDKYWSQKIWYKFEDLRNPRNKEARDEILTYFGLDPKATYGENFKKWCEDNERNYLKGYYL